MATSKRFTVLSRFTAFLAVDRSEVANARGNPRPIVQPVERPAGWNLPVGGAMDSSALRLANLLVGSEPDAAGLEVTLTGPAISFDEPTLLAITGGQCEPHCGDRRVPMWRAVLLPATKIP